MNRIAIIGGGPGGLMLGLLLQQRGYQFTILKNLMVKIISRKVGH